LKTYQAGVRKGSRRGIDILFRQIEIRAGRNGDQILTAVIDKNHSDAGVNGRIAINKVGADAVIIVHGKSSVTISIRADPRHEAHEAAQDRRGKSLVRAFSTGSLIKGVGDDRLSGPREALALEEHTGVVASDNGNPARGHIFSSPRAKGFPVRRALVTSLENLYHRDMSPCRV